MKLMRLVVLGLILTIVNHLFAQEPIKTVKLNEVEIKSKRTSRLLFTVDTLSLKSLDNISFSDIGTVLRAVPNVSGIKKGAFGMDPVIRGFKFSQVNVLINGSIKIEGGCPNRMDPTASHIDVTDLKKVEIHKGINAIRYGPAFGGTVNLITWQPVFYEKYKTDIEGVVGIQSSGRGYKSKIKIGGANRFFTYSVTAGRREYDDYQDGNGNYIKSSLTSYDFSGNLGFLIARDHIIDAGVIVSRGRNVDFPALSMDEREDNTNVYSLNYTFNPGKADGAVNLITVKSWYSDVNHIMDNKNRPFSDTVVAISTIDAYDGGFRSYGNFNLGRGVLEAGIDMEIIKKDGQRDKQMIKQPMLPVKSEALWDNALIKNSGLYLRYICTGPVIDWIAGLRVDYNSASSDTLFRMGMSGPVYENGNTHSDYLNFSFNSGLTWHVSDSYDLSFSLGRGVRSPDMTERFIILLPVGYDRFDYIGNPQLDPEVNYEFDLKNTLFSKTWGNANATFFFSYVTDYIGSRIVPPSEMLPQTPGVLGVKEFINIDKVWLTGFEFNYATPSGKRWQANINASYTYGRNPEAEGYKVENNTIVDTYTIIDDPLPEIPPFEFNFYFKYGFFDQKLVPELHWRAVAAQKKVSQSYLEQESNSFQLLDLKLSYRFNDNFALHGGVNNVFDKYYYEHLNRNIIGSSIPLYEPGRNFYLNFIVKF
jgi:iron complex outermembrane receptor protein